MKKEPREVSRERTNLGALRHVEKHDLGHVGVAVSEKRM